MLFGVVASECLLVVTAQEAPTEVSLGKDGYAQSGDVRIHYVTAGTGPLLVLIHGFPDYWYTWRRQMPALAARFQVVAIDSVDTTSARNHSG